MVSFRNLRYTTFRKGGVRLLFHQELYVMEECFSVIFKIGLFSLLNGYRAFIKASNRIVAMRQAPENFIRPFVFIRSALLTSP